MYSVIISQCGVLFGSVRLENLAEVKRSQRKAYESNEKISNYRVNDTGKTLRLVRGKVQFLQKGNDKGTALFSS